MEKSIQKSPFDNSKGLNKQRERENHLILETSHIRAQPRFTLIQGVAGDIKLAIAQVHPQCIVEFRGMVKWHREQVKRRPLCYLRDLMVIYRNDASINSKFDGHRPKDAFVSVFPI
jgi:hypothetical protein